MNYPESVEELLHWDWSTGRDSFGEYHIITGYEGTGGCFWCGKELEGRRRFCGHKSGCWTRYQEYFCWPFARNWCLKRYDYHCANCGTQEVVIFKQYGTGQSNLEVHHIIPLEGMYRAYSPYNVPWNLICLCHYCHQLIHAVMRDTPRSDLIDVFELARAKGQGVFELIV